VSSPQNWEDPDIPELLTWLEDELRAHIAELSSFDVYKKEVLSGSLDWTPMHTSEQFWRENVGHFEEKDFQILRVLVKLLEAGREPRTLAVACHDLGHFITYYPGGKGIVTELKAKERVLQLVQHPDADVQKAALLATQKILLSKDKVDYLSQLT
jgi:V-type H+-transporting ATPase subunit H